MESYRDMIYRYSTGFGPSVNVALPEYATDWASFKLKPLRYNLSLPLMDTDLKREADRLSMQVESANRIILTFGSNQYAEKCYTDLKNRLELIKYLLLHRGIRYITNGDLESLHNLFAKNKDKVDAAIDLLIEKYKVEIPPYPEHAYQAHPGYLEYDEFGHVVPKKPPYSPVTFEGLDLSDKKPWLVAAVVAVALILFKKKKGR